MQQFLSGGQQTTGYFFFMVMRLLTIGSPTLHKRYALLILGTYSTRGSGTPHGAIIERDMPY